MLKFIFLFLVILCYPAAVVAQSGVCAKNVLFSTKVTKQFNQDTQSETSETKISFSLGPLETVCFQVESLDGSTKDVGIDGRKYYFTFDYVNSIFAYKNAYTFALGDPKVKCLCDCPGIENHCDTSRDSCDEDKNLDENCFNYYSSDHPTEGCGIASFLGSGEVCCSVSIKPKDDTRYTAFEISTPVTRANFRMEKDSPYQSRNFASDLNQVAPHFDDKLQISFVNPGNVNPLPDGWYFGVKDKKNALTNVEVNGLSDWDVSKLGWFKYQNSKFSLSQTAVKNAFDSRVLNCDDSDMNVTFYSDANITFAKEIQDFYKATIENAYRDDNSRTLAISYRKFTKINVMITIPGAKRIVQEFSMPSFMDFMGEAFFDMHSNRFLNVTVVSAKGTIYGIMRSGTSTIANFDFTIEQSGGGLSNYTNYVQITQWCNDTMLADLCFHTGDTDEVCKVIKCHEEPLMDFVLPNTAINYEKGEKPNFFGLSTWKKYLNPLEWFNGIDSWQEGVIMAICIIVYILIILLIIKIIRCFNCGLKFCSCLGRTFCCCCKRKKKNSEKHSVKSRKSTRKEPHRVTRSRHRSREQSKFGSFKSTISNSFRRKRDTSQKMLHKLGPERYKDLRDAMNVLSDDDLDDICHDYRDRNTPRFQSSPEVCLVDLNGDDRRPRRPRSANSRKPTRSKDSMSPNNDIRPRGSRDYYNYPPYPRYRKRYSSDESSSISTPPPRRRSNDFYKDRPWKTSPDNYDIPNNRHPNLDNRANYESEDSTDSVISDKFDPPPPMNDGIDEASVASSEKTPPSTPLLSINVKH